MPTCHFFLFTVLLFSLVQLFNSSSKYDHYYFTEFRNNSSTSLSLVPSTKILNYFVPQSNFEVSVVLHYFKFHCFGLRNSNTPYYLLSHNIIVRPIVSRKCFFSFILLFLSGDNQLNAGPVSSNNQCVSSPLDVYEPFSSLTASNLRIATLNSRSMLIKSVIINKHKLESKIDILYITETYINDGQFSNSLLSFYFHPTMFFRSIIAGLIRPVVVVLLLLTRNLFIILCIHACFFHIRAHWFRNNFIK